MSRSNSNNNNHGNNRNDNTNSTNLLTELLLHGDIIDPKHLELLYQITDRAAHLLIQQIPIVQNVVQQMIDTVFIPRVMGRQLMVLIALETGLITFNQLQTLIQYLFMSTFSTKHRLIKQLEYQQKYVVNTQDEWMDIAERIDAIQGNDIWRSNPNCPLYERERIQARIDEFVHLMRRRDIFELMFLLRGSIGRNKFGLLHEGLFTKALAGSKVLTETYHNVVCAALDFVCDAPVLPEEEPIPTDARLAFFNETRHAYGRTALLLSGGAALGFYHVGLVKTLMDNGLMPRVIGGSSAGSIVCSMIGTRTDQECMDDLFNVRGTNAPGHSGQLKMNFFRPLQIHPNSTSNNNDHIVQPNKRSGGNAGGGILQVYYNTAGAFHDMKRTLIGLVPLTLRTGANFIYNLVTGNMRPQDILKNDTKHFRECVRANVGDFTFQEAFDRTGRILNIVVTPNNSSDPPRLLNYLTAPHVMVWSAAVASSSLPGVFEANRLVVKEADGWERYENSGSGQVFSDGSMEQDLPMQQLSEMFNINHFIISQANPHAVLFASYNQKMSVWTNPVIGFVHQILTFVRNQLRSWLLNFVYCVGARRITPLFETQRGIGLQFFTQEYEGRSTDISLVPWLGHRGLFSALLHIIYNPSEAEFREWIQASERETWKYIPAIKSHIAEEVTLDRCVQRLRRRLLHESFEKQKQQLLEADHLHPQLQQQQKVGTTAKKVTISTEGQKQNISSEGRVPSFYTTPSLIDMSGLGVGDHPPIHEDIIHDFFTSQHRTNNEYAMPIHPIYEPPPVSTVVANGGMINPGPGWGGMGLSGNRSSGNLHRNLSDASGFFIDDIHPNEQQQQQQTDHPTQHHQQQDAGEASTAVATPTPPPTTATSTITPSSPPSSPAARIRRASMSEVNSIPSIGSSSSMNTYVKTTTMAKFYYRKSIAGNEDYLHIGPLSTRPRSTSTSAIFKSESSNHSTSTDDKATTTGTAAIRKDGSGRRKARSHTNLETSMGRGF